MHSTPSATPDVQLPERVSTEAKAIPLLDDEDLREFYGIRQTVEISSKQLFSSFSCDEIMEMLKTRMQAFQVIVESLKAGRAYTSDHDEEFSQISLLLMAFSYIQESLTLDQIELLDTYKSEFKNLVMDRDTILAERLKINVNAVQRQIGILFRIPSI